MAGSPLSPSRGGCGFDFVTAASAAAPFERCWMNGLAESEE